MSRIGDAYDALFRLNDLMGEHFPDSVKDDPNAVADMELLMDVIGVASALRGDAPHGWKMVPVEPTKQMLEVAADNLCNRFNSSSVRAQEIFGRAAYEELVHAAPEPPRAR